MVDPLLLLGFLSHPVNHPPSELHVWRMFGTVCISQSIVLLGGGLARGQGSENFRRWAYYTLVVGELLLVPVAGMYVKRYGRWNASAIGFVCTMAFLCCLRCWALFFAPRGIFIDDGDRHAKK